MGNLKFNPEFNPIELRSEEVQEVISHVPGRIIQWGITVIFMVLLSMLTISWFVKYPDILIANVLITTIPAPVTSIARANGSLVVVKKNNEPVLPGDVIGYIQSTANVDAVLALEKRVQDNLPVQSPVGSLGDLEPGYSRLLSETTALKTFEEARAFDVQISQLKKQEDTHKKLHSALVAQNKFSQQELELAREKFKTDSALFVQRVTAAMDFNQTKSTWLQQIRAARNAEMTLLNNELQLNQLAKQITDLELQRNEQQERLLMALENARKELLANISTWKQTYLFVASVPGKVAWLVIAENDRFIEAGKPVVSVIPAEGSLTARAELPVRGSGKVKAGQKVNIKLENYPFEQFGTLTGTIVSVSQLPSEEKYIVTIELPEGLRTNLSQTLPFRQQLSGVTEIITEDLRLLERLFYEFRKLVRAR